MRKAYRIQLCLTAALLAGCLAGCGGSEKASAPVKEEAQIAAETPTATPKPTATITPTPMPEPVKYQTEDKKMILYLPDKSWENVSDQDGIRLFESEGKGNITILHGTKEELEDFIIPDSEKAVGQFYKENGIGKRDYEVQKYVNNSIGDVGIYRYTVRFEEAAGFEYVYSVNYVVTAGSEIFSVSGTVQQDDVALLEQITNAVESLQICETDATAAEQTEDGHEESNEKDGGTSEDFQENPQFVEP